MAVRVGARRNRDEEARNPEHGIDEQTEERIAAQPVQKPKAPERTPELEGDEDEDEEVELPEEEDEED